MSDKRFVERELWQDVRIRRTGKQSQFGSAGLGLLLGAGRVVGEGRLGARWGRAAWGGKAAFVS